MRSSGFLTAFFVAAPLFISAQEERETRKGSTIGDTPTSKILEDLGAEMEHGIKPARLDGYSQHFQRVDLDGDGRHSKVEYIEKGNYLTPEARRGIFNAADSDQDGFVTKDEYIMNRIITDEAKAIVQSMDEDGDGVVEREEFLVQANARLFDAELTGKLFDALDTNNDGKLLIPEYLRVWGKWARAGEGTPEERLASARKVQETAKMEKERP